MKNVFAKILILALCFCFALSSLVGCKTDDQIADLQGQIDQNKTDDKADADALAALKTLVEQIKATADSAATAAALQEVVDNLAGVKATADAAATAAKLAEVEEALKALITANGTTDASVKAEIEAALAAVKTTADAAATKAALDAAIADLNGAINTEKTNVVAELEAVKNSIAANKTAADNAIEALTKTVGANNDTATKAIADLAAAVKDNKAAADAAIAAVKETADAAATKLALDELAATVEANRVAAEKAVADLKAIVATDEELAAAVAELNNAIAVNTEAINKLNDAAATKAELTAVQNKVTALEGTLTAKDSELNAAIDAVKAIANAAATKAELNAAVAKLNETIANNKAAADKAVDDLKAIVATDEEVAAAVKEAVDTLDAAIKANTDNIAKNAADIAKNAADIKANGDRIAALQLSVGKIEPAIAGLQTTVDGLDAAIKALESKVDNEIATINGKLSALEAKDSELKGLIDGVQAQVETLKAEIKNLHADGSFADYVEATKVLNGDAKIIVDEEGKVVSVITDKESAEWATAELYSIAAFEAIAVDSKNYTPDAFKAFEDYQDDIVFFLGRAISAQAIVDYFADLNKYIADMPSFNETLKDLLDAKMKTGVTTAEDDLAAIETVIISLWNNGGDLDEYNTAAYNALKDAHINLLVAAADAKAEAKGTYEVKKIAKDSKADNYAVIETVTFENDGAEALVNAIGHVIFNAESKNLIDAAKAEIETLKTDYFTKEDYVKYYVDTETSIVANYNVLTTADARYAELVEANANKINVIAKALNFSVERPLWTDKEALDVNLDAFKLWLDKYHIDEKADADSISIIYPDVDINAAEDVEVLVDPINALKLAVLYADAMDGIYKNTVFAEGLVGVEALNNAVATLMSANEKVLYKDYNAAKGYEKNYSDLDADIKSVKLYDANVEDNNYAEMVKAISADFAEYLERQTTLHNANLALNAYYERNKDLRGKVTFNDWARIDQFGKDIAGIIEEAGVVVERDAEGKVIGDENYLEFGNDEKDPFALQEALVEEYLALTAKVREIYDTVDKLLNDSNAIALTFGNKITEFMAELANIMALGVTDIDLPLPGKDGAEDVNLQDLMDKLEIVIDAFVEKAEAAQLAAKDVAAAIATLANFETNNLNDYDDIAAVKAVLDAWIAEYLAADVKDANADELQAVKNVAEVQVYLAEAGTYYVFVVEGDYTTCVTAMNAAQAKYDLAKAAWAGVLAELDGLTKLNWNIHTKGAFEKANENYVAYINEYYAGKLEVSIDTDENGALVVKGGVFGELDVYAAFVAQRDKCYDMATAASAEAGVIKGLIESLASAITADNYADQLDIINEINEKLEAYKKYCAEICNDCIPHALQITLREKEATALLYEYAADAKAKANDATDAEIDKSVALYSGVILAANDGKRTLAEVIATIDSTLASGKSAIAKKAPCCVGGDHGDANKDHACDYCDAPVSDCPVALGTAHTCDCGATSDCPVAEGTAHSCTCGATSDCPVVEGTAHSCICGATSGCVDTDPADEKCDICGADLPHFE